MRFSEYDFDVITSPEEMPPPPNPRPAEEPGTAAKDKPPDKTAPER